LTPSAAALKMARAPSGEVTMTGNDFRDLALALPEAAEAAHMGHPDFRVGGKIFATLVRSDQQLGMVKLTPAQQRLFARAEPKVFVPVKGAWGRRGCTNVVLAEAKEQSVRQALVLAWQNTAPKRLADAFEG
jgi:hypothetical protein